MLAIGFAILLGVIAGSQPKAADAVPANPATNRLPVYDLKIVPAEWAKLERDPYSDQRHPAKLVVGGKEYSVAVRYRGEWARSWPKKPLKVFLEKGQNLDGLQVLNLNSNWRDPSFIREQLAYQIYAACGVPAPRTRMVKLLVNGQFHGVFLEVEQPAKAFLERSKLPGATIYKASSHEWGSDQRDLGSELAYHAHYEKENHKDQDYRDLQGFCHDLATTRNAGSFFTNQVALEEYINYLAATALVQNWDCFNKNHFLIHDTAGSKRWLVVPWDLDRTLGDHWHGSFDEARLPLQIGTSALQGPTGWNHLMESFFKDPGLRARLLNRLEFLLQNEFTKEKLFPLVDRLESEARADARLDRLRWSTQGVADIHEGIAGLKRFIEERRAFLLGEIKAQRAGEAGR